jgi:cytochrome c oxidase subunit IV
MLGAPLSQARRLLLWLMLIVLAALVAYFGVRGYLMPEMLFLFSSTLAC